MGDRRGVRRDPHDVHGRGDARARDRDAARARLQHDVRARVGARRIDGARRASAGLIGGVVAYLGVQRVPDVDDELPDVQPGGVRVPRDARAARDRPRSTRWPWGSSAGCSRRSARRGCRFRPRCGNCSRRWPLLTTEMTIRRTCFCSKSLAIPHLLDRSGVGGPGLLRAVHVGARGAVGRVALPARDRADAGLSPLLCAPRVPDEPGRALRLDVRRHRRRCRRGRSGGRATT